MNPAISVIVPVYNTEKYLDECIQSILNQSFTDFELLLIDDGSTDRSGEICDQYVTKDERVRVFHKENSGVSSARNVGLDEAKGEWIAFVDSDDWVEPNMYQKLYNEIIVNQLDIVWCDYCCEYENYKEIVCTKISTEDKVTFIQDYLLCSLTPLWAMLVKTDIIIKNNIRFLDGCDWCEDLNVATKLYYYSNSVSYLAEPLYHYRSNPSSITHTINRKKKKARLKNILDLYNFFIGKEMYEAIKKYLFYRILIAKQFYLYDEKRITTYMELMPETNMYILSNPFYGIKSKSVEWLVIKLYALIIRLSDIKI